MEKNKLPKTLHVYTMYTAAGAFSVCSEVSTGDGMWECVKKARSDDKNTLVLWVSLSNGTYERIYLDANAIVGVGDKSNNVPPLKPYDKTPRKADAPRRAATSQITRNSHPSRVTIGQSAKKPKR